MGNNNCKCLIKHIMKKFKIKFEGTIELEEVKNEIPTVPDPVEPEVPVVPDPVEPEVPVVPPTSYLTLEQFGGGESFDNYKPLLQAYLAQQESGLPIVLGKDKTYKIYTFKMLPPPNSKIRIYGNNSSLQVGVDFYERNKDGSEDGYLFDLRGVVNPDVMIYGVSIDPPLQETRVQLRTRRLFLTDANMKDGFVSVTQNSNRQFYPTWQMGTFYAGGTYKNGDVDKYLFVHNANSHHIGAEARCDKANSGAGLFVLTDNMLIESDYNWNQAAYPVKGKFDWANNRFYPENFDVTRIQVFPTNDNYGRWWSIQMSNTYLICDGDIDPETNSVGFRGLKQTGKFVKLSNTKIGIGTDSELNPSDLISISGKEYTVLTKEMKEPITREDRLFIYELDKNVEVDSGEYKLLMSKKLDESDIYLCFRGNYITKATLSTADIEYRLRWVALGNMPNKPIYSHEENTVIHRDTKLIGFYRNSSNSSIQKEEWLGRYSKGYTMINCEGFKDQFLLNANSFEKRRLLGDTESKLRLYNCVDVQNRVVNKQENSEEYASAQNAPDFPKEFKEWYEKNVQQGLKFYESR